MTAREAGQVSDLGSAHSSSLAASRSCTDAGVTSTISGGPTVTPRRGTLIMTSPDRRKYFAKSCLRSNVGG